MRATPNIPSVNVEHVMHGTSQVYGLRTHLCSEGTLRYYVSLPALRLTLSLFILASSNVAVLVTRRKDRLRTLTVLVATIGIQPDTRAGSCGVPARARISNAIPLLIILVSVYSTASYANIPRWNVLDG